MISRFDEWLEANGPVALKIREPLRPVLGEDAVFFPPTFAPDQDGDEKKKSGYVVDAGVCLVDTVGAQANRIEPLFKRPGFDKLVPQVVVRVGDRMLNLLDAGHRAADAVVRFSGLAPHFQAAFLALRERGDAKPLAKIAPTSIVFGVWDSRDTQVKLPRLVESTIRAYGAEPLTRAAQYFSAIEEDYRKEQGLDKESLGDAKFPAESGLVDNPSGRVLGGVRAKEGIRREALLNLVALRALAAETAEESRKLQRYILGLALVAFQAPAELFLRQGCLLCAAGQTTVLTVARNGHEAAANLSGVEDYAAAAAQAFGVGEALTGDFSPKAVKDKLEESKAAKAAKKTKK